MNYVIRKLITLFSTLMLVSLITFGVFQILPGNPVNIILGVDADPLQAQALTEKLNLNKPLGERYVYWIKELLKGNLGDSIRYQTPVAELIGHRLPVTVSVTVLALIFTLLIGIPLGIWLARKNNKGISILVSMLSQLGIALPSFWLGIILIMIFSATLNLLPSGGFVPFNEDPLKSIRSLMLPAISISIGTSAVVVRYLKNTLLDEMKLDYVRTAYSKGLREGKVIYKHVLRNALIPVVTIFGMISVDILGGSIITENVFALPGLGSLVTAAVGSRDLPLVQGLVLYLAVIVVAINFIVDMLYSVIDPRIRLK